MKVIVDISDARYSNKCGDELITYSLGSCIGVAMHDPATKATGLLHYQLPNSKTHASGNSKNPLMFADTGVAYLVDKLTSMGANPKRLKVKVAGGAQIMNDAKMFNIGKRNHSAIRQILWKKGIFIEAEEVGGNKARTMTVRVSDGAVVIKSEGKERML